MNKNVPGMNITFNMTEEELINNIDSWKHRDFAPRKQYTDPVEQLTGWDKPEDIEKDIEEENIKHKDMIKEIANKDTVILYNKQSGTDFNE